MVAFMSVGKKTFELPLLSTRMLCRLDASEWQLKAQSVERAWDTMRGRRELKQSSQPFPSRVKNGQSMSKQQSLKESTKCSTSKHGANIIGATTLTIAQANHSASIADLMLAASWIIKT